LLQALGKSLQQNHLIEPKRPGALFDYISSRYVEDNQVGADDLLHSVLDLFSPIWPSRLTINEQNLGDVWRHSAIKTGDLTHELIPFHKLSQWLTYSLLEPLEEGGLNVTKLDALTGLPEYRNGGLFLDSGVISPRAGDALEKTYQVQDEFIVEWRALTVTLIEELAPLIRAKIGKSESEFPLARVLEGGTWKAGREIAQSLRSDGGSPVTVQSDGTVF